MKHTLFIGGASPMGSRLAYGLKKKLKTYLTVVDIPVEGKQLTKMYGSDFYSAEQFAKEYDNTSFNYVIINLYELLDVKTMEYCKENGNLFLSLLNKVVSILQNNPSARLSILLNSYQYHYPEGHYQVSFNLYNELVTGFVGILSKQHNSSLNLIYLPNVLISYESKGKNFVDIAIDAIKEKRSIDISDGYRDYVLWRNIEQPVTNLILEESGQVVEITSGSCHSNKKVYELLTEKSFPHVEVSFIKQPYQFKHFQEWNPSRKSKSIIVSESIEKALQAYIEY